MDGHIKENKQQTSPRLTSNFISKIFFWWVTPFMSLGNERELQVDDLYKCLPEDESGSLGLKLQREWDKERTTFTNNQDSKKGDGADGPSLTKAIFRAFGLKFMAIGFISLLEECFFKIGQPICLGRLIQYFDPGSTMPTWEAYLYATGVVLGSGLYVITHHPYFFECCHAGMHLRIASCSIVYKKCLKLSQESLGNTTIGQMVNIMSNDVNRFDNTVIFLHYLWVGPLQAIITTTILYFVLGPTCFVGLAVIFFFVPLQMGLARVFSKQRMETAKKTDERVRTMNEIVSGMKVIKMYTWEKPFVKLIELCRKMEINVIRRTAYLRAFNTSLFFTSSKLIVFLTFMVYVLTGNGLTSNVVFLTVSLYNNIRLVMTKFPNAISTSAEALITVKRIENFLLLEEIDEVKVKGKKSDGVPVAECNVECKYITVKWPAAGESEGNTLTDISFTVRPGQVLAVVGQVGSGKSSLLNVLLGELSLLQGERNIKGKLAYASQEPWIFSSTIRQNILCGSKYDPHRYKRVIRAAALERDFKLFPEGDRTAVGEKGASLSGGQKARVNLARCLYVDADIYLMDDPLSAVDTHVGRHLFDKAIKEFLHDKIRVLVTHQLQYLKDVDQILILKEGRLEVIGTYEEIHRKGLDLTKVIEEEEELGEIEEEEEIIESLNRNDTTRSSRISRSSSRFSSFRKRRNPSIISQALDELVNEAKPAFAEETRSSGGVGLSIYKEYFVAGGGWISFSILVFNCLFTQVLFSASDYWLNLWTNSVQLKSANLTPTVATTLKSENISSNHSWQEEIDTYTGIYVYSILICGVFAFSVIRTLHFFVMCLITSVKLHNQMFQSIIRARLSFFDKNPVGRILNRFTKDIGCIDDQLPVTFFDVISVVLNALGIVIVVAVVNPWLLLPVFILAIIFYQLRNIYLAASREVKRLESTTRSPVFTHISSSLVGLTTLRAHNCQEIFQRVFDECQDVHSSAWYMFLSSARWFGILLDWICVIYLASVTYTCTGFRDSISSSEAGLAISSAMSLTGVFQWAVRQSAETDNQMTSVERVMEYGQLPSEANLESTPDKKPHQSWPTEGNVVFDNMSLSYNEVDQPVLKGISCSIKAKEKIGIVGRTGAGKSSLITALFRLSEPEGRIIIDGIEISNIGLRDLRSKISIIPQDPVLFSGSLRKNLDPFGEYSDDVLWNSLEDAHFKESLADLEGGLDSAMTEGGSNLSVGQRQLVCLARAILRQNKILVLDEATANVDQRTDMLIQTTIREKFRDCTVLTIAHRLNTIMDSDKIMVLDGGHLKEYDKPTVLLENAKSMFYSLVEQAGPLAAAELIEFAKQAAAKQMESI